MTRRLHHARRAYSLQRWHWTWRRLTCLAFFYIEDCADNEIIDTGYCIDRYMLGDSL